MNESTFHPLLSDIRWTCTQEGRGTSPGPLSSEGPTSTEVPAGGGHRCTGEACPGPPAHETGRTSESQRLPQASGLQDVKILNFKTSWHVSWAVRAAEGTGVSHQHVRIETSHHSLTHKSGTL